MGNRSKGSPNSKSGAKGQFGGKRRDPGMIGASSKFKRQQGVVDQAIARLNLQGFRVTKAGQ